MFQFIFWIKTQITSDQKQVSLLERLMKKDTVDRNFDNCHNCKDKCIFSAKFFHYKYLVKLNTSK